MVVVLVAGAAPARAERDVHAGLNARTDLGTNQFRVQVGGRWNAFEASVVVDPHTLTSRQSDQDVVLAWWFAPGRFGTFGGWRVGRVELLGMSTWHEKVIGGLVAQLPTIGSGRVRLVGGVEVCMDIARHGAGERTEWVDASSRRAFDDLINLSLFARAELAFGK